MPTAHPAPEITLPALMRLARRTYGKAIRAALAEAGFDDIPTTGLFVIGAISRSGAPLAHIIEHLGTSKQAVGQLVDTLVLRGYLEREVDPDDRRRLTVRLGERGQAAAKLTLGAVARIDARLARRVPAEWIEHTRATLLALIEDDHDD
jgi:DNA-binding MarR family transcriptional regulator